MAGRGAFSYAALARLSLAGKKRGLDASVSKVFKRFVQAAEDSERRTGRGGMLLLRAAKLFAHVRDVLKLAPGASVINSDYTTVLRAHLLAEPAYCAATPTSTFQELLSLVMRRLEERPGLSRSEECFRTVALLALLLQRFPGDMAPAFQGDTLAFFRGTLLSALVELQEDSRITSTSLGALNAFLLANGADVAAGAPALHAAARPLLARCWRGARARDPRLRDCLVTYLGIQVQLGGLEDANALQEAQELLEGDMRKPRHSWSELARDGRQVVQKQAYAQLRVSAAVALRSLQRPPPIADDSDDDALPAKRQKVATPAAALQEQALAAPAAWAPLAALLVRDHARRIPDATYAAWLQALAPALAAPGSPLAPAAPGDANAEADAMWALRYIAQLAAAWPAGLLQDSATQRGGAAGFGGSAAGFGGAERGAGAASPAPAGALRAAWKAVWEAVVGWLADAGASNAAQDEAALALAAIAGRHLVADLRSPRLLRAPLLARAGLSDAALVLIAAVHGHGGSAGSEDAGERGALLDRVVAYLRGACSGDGAAGRWTLVARAAAALMGAEAARASPDADPAAAAAGARAARWWQEDAESAALQADLAGLARAEVLIVADMDRSDAADDAAHAVGAARAQKLPAAVSGELQSRAATGLAAELAAEEAAASMSQGAGQGLGLGLGSGRKEADALLSAVAAALACGVALFRGGVSGTRTRLDANWGGRSPLAGVMASAVQCGAQALVGGLESRVAPSAEELDVFAGAMRALRSYARATGSSAAADGLQGMARRLQQVFDAAGDAAAGAAGAAAHAAVAAAGSREIYDDDLDAGGGAVGAALPSAAGAGRTAAAAALRAAAVRALGALGNVQPHAAADALSEVVEACLTLQPRSEELTALAIQELCGVVADGALERLPTAAGALGAQAPGLLSVERYCDASARLALQQVATLAAALAAQAQAGGAPGQAAAAQEVGIVLMEALDKVAEADGKPSGLRSSWRTRVALSRAILAVLQLGRDVLEEKDLDDCISSMASLLADDAYPARCAAAKLVPQLYPYFPNKQAMFDSLRERLCLESLHGLRHAHAEEAGVRMETSVMMLGETLAASGELEHEALYLAAAHAAASAAGTRAAYLGAAAADLVPALLTDKRAAELRKMAAALGTDAKALLSKHAEDVYGVMFPYTQQGAERRHFAESVLVACLGEFLSDHERDDLFANAIVETISRTLLMAADGDVPPQPYFSVAAVVDGIMAMPGQDMPPAEKRRVILEDILQTSGVQHLLADVHASLERARHPRHLRRALAPLHALLQLLGERACEPATLRYVLALLLRLLHTPGLQAELFAGLAEAAELAPVGGAKPSLHPNPNLDSGSGAPAALAALLGRLTAGAPAALRPYLKTAEPLPATGAMAPAAAALETARTGVDLAEELRRLAARAGSAPPSQLARSVAALRASLAARGSELLLHCELLARVGPGDPFCIALPHAAGHGSDSTVAPAEAGPGEAARKPRGKAAQAQDSRAAFVPQQEALVAGVLAQLADCLADGSLAVVRAAQRTLRRLLSTLAGTAALARVPEPARSYVSVFQPMAGAAALADADVDTASPATSLDSNALWAVGARGYEAWVCELAHALLSRAPSPMLRMCQSLALLRPAMAELLLPHILADLATLDSDGHLAAALSNLVAKHVFGAMPGEEPGSRPGSGAAGAGVAPLKAVRLMLSALNYLRSVRLDELVSGRGSAAARWAQVYWLEVDYLAVAAAALRCGACFTALLYLEHWCEAAHGRLALGNDQPLAAGGLAEVDRLLLDAHAASGEPDGLYAVARSHKLAAQLRLFEHEGAWSKALVARDLQLLGAAQGGDAGPARAEERAGLVHALQQLGCAHIISAYWASLPSADGELGELRAECAWRMGEWTSAREAVPAPEAAAGPGFHQALCGCLKALEGGDQERCSALLDGAGVAVVRALAAASTESAARVAPAIVRLQMLVALREAWALRWPGLALGLATPDRGSSFSGVADGTAMEVDGDELLELDAIWRAREAAAGAGGRYDLQEPLVALRQALMRALGRPDAVAAALGQAATAARKAGRLPHALAALHRLQAPDLGPDATRPWQVEQAKLLWAQGQPGMALRLARALLADERRWATGPAGAAERASLLSLTGKWIAQNRSEGASAVLAMMQAAVDTLAGNGNAAAGPGAAASNGLVKECSDVAHGRLACRAAYRLAHYADGLYRSAVAHRQSPEWATTQAIIRHKRNEMEQLRAQLAERRRAAGARRGGAAADPDVRRLEAAITVRARPVAADEEEVAALAANEARYLNLALEHYRRCLMAGDAHDTAAVFRLCQLWFALGADARINAALAATLAAVPSWKFLPLAYQMASRMSATQSGALYDSGFQATLAELLVRMATEHPHHALYQLFALRAGGRGRGEAAGAAPARKALVHTIDRDKVAAAAAAIERVAANPRRQVLVEQMERLAEAYMDLAALPAPQKSSRVEEMPFPAQLRRSLKNLDQVPVVSVHVPVDPSCAYADLPHFVQFGETIAFVGGINMPKLVQCFDSAGVRHRQLVKAGNDDLRQDAVMQQFFALINAVLAESAAARARRLRIATYKVVPFSPAAGLLEWVEDTLPLSDYLTGRSRTAGAHARYRRPGDITFVDAYQAMAPPAAGQPAPPRGELRRIFEEEVCPRFAPVLHHFFLEHYREPAVWFERRLAYTRANAVNSMAGYVIGLGDRHSHNILLHTRTAEVVHIDLGIAFEQGRFLTTPELVPFRLTRDIVDGMGAAGVEGVMRRSCEETLRVLRAAKESLATIVEVFIHDPLYKWALSPAAAQLRQGGSQPGAGDAAPAATALGEGESGGDLVNADAERALLRVKHKLEGLDSGEGEARSVEGQVQQLLQEAADPDRLCRMYVGWAAWL
ncbi:hypothetical protein WJX81_003257 [Elliptochloris bilobata]|uniref:non-specific serine/threonine protein kinase n=1 Tax=Elliptochloris bilobata TaxID=381761 RepID=A0AAW1QWH7_9CHLO